MADLPKIVRNLGKALLNFNNNNRSDLKQIVITFSYTFVEEF